VGLALGLGLLRQVAVWARRSIITNMDRLFRTLLPAGFLAIAQAQDLPNGSGKEVTNGIRGACHEAGVVVKYRNAKEDWESVVEDMRGRAPTAPDDDFKVIIFLPGALFRPGSEREPNLTTVTLDSEQG
jgi:hypothetical protein